MSMNAEWLFPIGLGVLGTLAMFLTRGWLFAPARIKKDRPVRRNRHR